jgi:glycosyltransferase involved in cell wall biosynthesis
MKNVIKKCLSALGLWKITVWGYDFFSYHSFQFKFLVGIQKLEEFELGFFFNSYATGGAEKVQLEIVRSFSDHNATVFITNLCLNEHYKPDFEACSNLINIYKAVRKRDRYYPLILNLLARRINQMSHPRLLGCDCQLYYDLLPFLQPHVVVMDLFHTLVHSFEKGPEHWSLPIIDRIQKRIVISHKLQKDFEQFYSSHSVNLKLLERIQTIHNFVDSPLALNPLKPNIGKPIVLFVCRNHFVKRISLAGRIAYNLKLRLQFVFIGENIELEVSPDHRSDILFTGNISNAHEMANWYQKADFLMMTSSREGLPMVLLEGMSYGTIPIATKVGAISEIVPTPDLGILITNFDNEDEIVEEFVKGFLRLLEDPEKKGKIKQNVKKFVIQEFNKETFKQSYRQVLLSNV